MDLLKRKEQINSEAQELIASRVEAQHIIARCEVRLAELQGQIQLLDELIDEMESEAPNTGADRSATSV